MKMSGIMSLIQTGLNLMGGFVHSERHVQSIFAKKKKKKSTTCKSRTHCCPRMKKLSQNQKKKRIYIFFFLFVVFPNIFSSLEVCVCMCGNRFPFTPGWEARLWKTWTPSLPKSSWWWNPLRHLNSDPLISVHLRQVNPSEPSSLSVTWL